MSDNDFMSMRGYYRLKINKDFEIVFICGVWRNKDYTHKKTRCSANNSSNNLEVRR